ncbi:MAG TPA: MFS transporter [Leptolyngbyaceae cyanobacterium]
MNSSQEQSKETVDERSLSIKWWVLLGIAIGEFMYALDTLIVNIALPVLERDLHASFAAIQWIPLSYLLTIASLVLVVGRLGDMWNKKWLYFGGSILFTFGSLLCTFAPSASFLIGFRALQGVGAVIISVVGPAIITEVFPKEERGRALGIIKGIVMLGVTTGPSVGGLLIGLGGWRLIFWVNIPIGIITTLVVAAIVPSSVSSERKQGFDWLGSLLVMISLTCFTLAITLVRPESWFSLTQLILLVLATISLVCFLALENQISDPILDLTIFRSLLLSLSLLLGWMVLIVRVGITFILPFFLELVKNYPPLQAGLLMAVGPIFSALIAPVAGSLSDRFGARLVTLIGLVLMVIGCLSISTFNRELTVVGYIVRTFPLALGTGIFYPSNQSAVMGAVTSERLGIASGLLSLSQTLGETTGLTLIGTMFSLLTSASAKLASHIELTNAPIEALLFGVQMTFRIIAPILMVAAILTAFLWWLEQRKKLSYQEKVLPLA